MEQRDDETVYQLGDRVSDGKRGPYLEPTVDQEIDHLMNPIAAAGADITQASAWAEGESAVGHIARLRKTLRDLRGRR